MTFHELFGEISDASDEEQQEEGEQEEEVEYEMRDFSFSVCSHEVIEGLRYSDRLLPSTVQMRIAHQLRLFFGFHGDRNQGMLFGASSFPSFLKPLLEVGQRLLPLELQGRTPLFDQVIANHYHPGQGLTRYVDLARFHDGIVIFSFLSDIVMDFVPVADKCSQDLGYSNSGSYSIVQKNQNVVQVLLEKGSAVCLSDASRFNWAHGIAERCEDSFGGRRIPRGERISITLRKLKKEGEV